MHVEAQHTDTALIALAKSGDHLAFRAIVDRYEGKVVAVVLGMLGHDPESDDVGQETFIRFYRSLHDFREDASLGTYLTRIAINLSLNALKRRQRNFRNVDMKSVAREMYALGTSEQQERREARELVQKALGQMEPKFRSVIVLRMLEGYATKETAEILEIPVGTVLSRLKRAQTKLKEILLRMQ